jgi:hypothetical protein
MISTGAAATFATAFRVGPYVDAVPAVKMLWLWFMKELCGKVSRPWCGRVKFFSTNKTNDTLRAYLTKSDEVFAQLCIVLYHGDCEQRTIEGLKPKKGRRKGMNDLGTKRAALLYTTLFNRLTHLETEKHGVDWEEAVMKDVGVFVQRSEEDNETGGLFLTTQEKRSLRHRLDGDDNDGDSECIPY